MSLLKAFAVGIAATFLACGDSTPAPTEPEELDVRWVSIVAGGSDFTAFSCGLTDTGAAYCWGSNRGGALGADAGDESNVPVPVSGGITFGSISAGSYHVCGVAVDDTVYCWGQWELSSEGTPLSTPRAIPVNQKLSGLTSGSWNTCGLAPDGIAICWDGHPVHSAFGMTSVPSPTGGGISFMSISAGNAGGASFWCGLAVTDFAYCWGDNFFGSIGNGTGGGAVKGAAPAPVSGGLRFKALEAGYITCGITIAGAVYCWGGEVNYPPFIADVAGGLVPAPLSGGVAFESISVGSYHACGLTSAGAAHCWGENLEGELGAGSEVSGTNTPLQVAGGVVFRTVTAGNGHSCGTTADGQGYCWGSNDSGQLGAGSTVPTSGSVNFSRIPVRVRGPKG